MPSPFEIAERVCQFLAGHVELEEFEDWSALYSWDIHKRADRQTQELAYLIESLLVEHDAWNLNSEEMRRELANAVHPFVQPQGPCRAPIQAF